MSVLDKDALIERINSGLSSMTEDDLSSIYNLVVYKITAKERGDTFESMPKYEFKGEYVEPPKNPLAKWPGGRNVEFSIVEFLTTTYGEYFGKGMTRAHLENLDKGAYLALRVWERNNGKWLQMPTTKEHNDAMLDWVDKNDTKIVKEVLGQAGINRLEKLRARRVLKDHSPTSP